MPRPTTDAQREASRRNGARSRGPRTAKGKERSRMNSLKHGIFAKTITPPWETDEDQQAATELLNDLVDEFNPQTPSQRIMVELLADDLIGLRRAKQIHSLALNPEQLSERQPDYEIVPDYPDYELLDAVCQKTIEVIKRLRNGEAPHMNGELASWLADQIAEKVKDDLVRIDRVDAAGTDAGRDTRAVELKQFYEQLGVHRLGLDQPSICKQLLRRKVPLDVGLAARFADYLEYVNDGLFDLKSDVFNWNRKQHLKALEQRERQGRRLPQIDRVLGYEKHFANRIGKTLDRLQETGVRS